jgi:hypothetical protein
MIKSDLVQITYHPIKYGGDGEISDVEVAQIIPQTRCGLLHHKCETN